MPKRFQANEYGQQMEGDGQGGNNHPLPISYNKPQLINGVHSPRQGFDTCNREKYSGYDNNLSKTLCTEVENGKKSKTASLLPHIARHFSINDDDDDMLLPPNSTVDGHSKTGMDNPVALGPDQGYPKGSESTRGSNNGLVKPTLNVTSTIHLGRIDEMATHTYTHKADRNIAATENNQSQMREVWTKLYGKASAREETPFNSNLQPSYPMQAFNAGHLKSAGNLPQHISTVISNEGHTIKSDGSTVHRRPVHGSLQSDKPNTEQNLSSTIISTTKTRTETLKDEQKEWKGNGLKVNYQPTLVTSSDIVFLDVMNSTKYNAEEHNEKLVYKKNFHLSKNKTLFPKFSPIHCDQSKNQFAQNPAYNIEGSDQSILDINDSIFDYSATGSISEHSSISTNLLVVPALSSSASSTHGSKSESPDENKSKQDKTVNSVSPNERKPLHTKMTQLTKNSMLLEDRNSDLHVNFNVPNNMQIFSSRQSQQNQKDTCTDDGSMSFDIDDTILTVESIESDTERLNVQMPGEMINSHISNMDDIKQQLHNLTLMYQQLFHLLSQNKKLQNAQPWSIDSVKGNSLIKATQRRKSMRSTILETKHNKKHFQRLEAHVVTLVRSVATLTDQVQAHTNALKQIDILKEELQEMKATMPDGNNHVGISSLHKHLNEYERFRGWIPSLTNPKRVQKLTKFFGQEPPLLEIFLKKLGYERYLSNFSNEHIGMLELPYMTEERLQSIGIPMGPRLRILQESQLCFRQENFNIYII